MYNIQCNNEEKAREGKSDRTQNEQMKEWKSTERADDTASHTVQGWSRLIQSSSIKSAVQMVEFKEKISLAAATNSDCSE